MTTDSIKKTEDNIESIDTPPPFMPGYLVRALETILNDDLLVMAGDRGVIQHIDNDNAAVQVRWDETGQMSTVAPDSICQARDYVPAPADDRSASVAATLAHRVKGLERKARQEKHLREQAEEKVAQLEKRLNSLLTENTALKMRLDKEEARADEMRDLLAEQAMELAPGNGRIQQKFLILYDYRQEDSAELQKHLNDGWEDVHCKLLEDGCLLYDLRRELSRKPAPDADDETDEAPLSPEIESALQEAVAEDATPATPDDTPDSLTIPASSYQPGDIMRRTQARLAEIRAAGVATYENSLQHNRMILGVMPFPAPEYPDIITIDADGNYDYGEVTDDYVE